MIGAAPRRAWIWYHPLARDWLFFSFWGVKFIPRPGCVGFEMARQGMVGELLKSQQLVVKSKPDPNKVLLPLKSFIKPHVILMPFSFFHWTQKEMFPISKTLSFPYNEREVWDLMLQKDILIGLIKVICTTCAYFQQIMT